MELFQSVLLSDVLVFVVLFVAMAALTHRAVFQQNDYIGYALGWAIALLFILIYSSLGIEVPTLDDGASLNLFQIFVPVVFGLGAGAATILLLQIPEHVTLRSTLAIAFFTMLNVSLIFLMFVRGLIARRMIGIFALVFTIAVLIVLAVVQARRNQQDSDPSSDEPIAAQVARHPRPDEAQQRDPLAPRPGSDARQKRRTSTLNAIREDQQRNNR